jgi:hypothetical protein
VASDQNDARTLRRLRAELNRLSERVEIQARYTAVIEGKLRELMQEAGVAPVTVEIRDPILPLNGGVSLRTEAAAARENRPFAARTRSVATSSAETDHSWWPSASKAGRPLTPNAGWRNYSLHGWVKVVGISVCGFPREGLEAILALVAERQTASRDFIPVFLTDSTDFDLFRRYGFVFEYLPSPAKQATYAGTMSWAEYAAERRAFLERKWGLSDVICFGSAEFGRPAAEEPAVDPIVEISKELEPLPAKKSKRGRIPGGQGEARARTSSGNGGMRGAPGTPDRLR